MTSEQAAAVLGGDPDYRVLRRVCIGNEQVFAQNTAGEPCGRLAVIDTETAELNADLGDRIIDLAIITAASWITSDFALVFSMRRTAPALRESAAATRSAFEGASPAARTRFSMTWRTPRTHLSM